MYSNRAGGIAREPASVINQAQAADTAAVQGSASAAAASAAAAPLVTTRAALAETASASAAAAGLGAAPGAAAEPEYDLPLIDVLIGEVAGYLPGEDQVALRGLNDAAKKGTDGVMETLSLSPSDAAVLLRSATGLP